MDRRKVSIAILCAFCIGLPLRPEIDVNVAKGENMKLMSAQSGCGDKTAGFDGSLAANSNFGAANVDIAAPGSLILSTLPNHGFGFMSGTSMAAPMVTGTAALIYSCRPDLSLLDVRRVILDSARKIDGLNGRVATGGILDAYAAMMQ